LVWQLHACFGSVRREPRFRARFYDSTADIFGFIQKLNLARFTGAVQSALDCRICTDYTFQQDPTVANAQSAVQAIQYPLEADLNQAFHAVPHGIGIQ
jgi:hypothetical protein